MAGWHDSLDVMLRLTDWWKTREGVIYGNKFIESIYQVDSSMIGNQRQLQPGWLAETARTQLLHSEPIFVTSEVMDLVDSASDSFQSEPFEATDLLTSHGFVVLPRTKYVEAPRDPQHGTPEMITTVAFSWGPCASSDGKKSGTYMMLYSDLSDPKDSWHDQGGRLGVVPVAAGRAYVLWHLSPWWFGTTTPDLESKMNEHYMGSTYKLWHWLQTFFRISMQHIVVPEYRIPPKPWRKRAKRAGRDPGIMVVTLRRPKQKHHNGEVEVEWSHRWLVRAHWRNQWYPSLKMHRQILITPYVKGPEDKEFKAPALRAWDFRR